MPNWENFVKYFEEYTNGFSKLGIACLVADIILVLALIIFVFKVLKLKLKLKKVFLFILVILLVYGIAYFCGFKISFAILKTVAFWSIGMLIILYSQEIRHALESGLNSNSASSAYSTEEEKAQVINIIVDSAQYLAERKIGALICVERSDNLDSFINKAIKIKAELTAELLTSLFFTGTATHDGAVIVRKNNIMCAGAYLPATDKYDVPKALGTRHRAAIGLSEKYDAITVVVSEETGNISITVDGIIQEKQTLDEVREKLSEYLIKK